MDIVGWITVAILIIGQIIRYEQRLTKIETKLNYLLERNGIYVGTRKKYQK
jgi:nitrate reductase gamma subunit